MICNLILKKINKITLSPQYRQQFTQSLSQIQQKYSKHVPNKALIVKKVCKKYLKICNSTLNSKNISQSIQALQFIKSLQFQIYEGKSYELYLIKITLHILFLKSYELSIKESEFIEEQRMWVRKKQTYVERLKLFLEELETSFFTELIAKDYYSNVELILFHIIKRDLECLVQRSSSQNLETQLILIKVETVRKYVNKLFQILKCHILQLNEMLFYLQKKVYELLSAKVKFMIELFIIQTQIVFLQEVAEESLHSEEFNASQNDASQNDASQNDASQNDGDRSVQLLFQNSQDKFINEQIEHLWEKYDSVFNKIPNNVNQKQVFQRVNKIISRSKQKNATDKTKKQVSKLKKRKSGQSQESSSEENNQHNIYNQESSSGNALSDQRQSQMKNEKQSRQCKRIKTKCLQKRTINQTNNYKIDKNRQMMDFIQFSDLNNRQKYFSQFQSSPPSQNNVNFITPLQRLSTYDRIEQGSFKNQNISSKKLSQNQIDHISDFQNSLESKNIQQIPLQRQKTKDYAKKSSFCLIKDMNNNFQYICQKNSKSSLRNMHKQMGLHQIKQSQTRLKNSYFNKCHNQMQNLTLKFNTLGFKRLYQVKNTDLTSLKLRNEHQFERLRKIKSVDMISLKENMSEKKTHKSQQKKGKSQSVFFPFMKNQTIHQAKNGKMGFSLDLPKLRGLSKQKGKFTNFIIQASTKKNQLKLRQTNILKSDKDKGETQNLKQNVINNAALNINRSKSKKTTLDDMNMDMDKIRCILDLAQSNIESKQNSINLPTKQRDRIDQCHPYKNSNVCLQKSPQIALHHLI